MKRLAAVIIIVVLITVAVAAAAYTPHARSLHDAFLYLVYLHDDATTYAAGFSEANFDRVRAEMSEAEVLSLLGEPLRKHGENSRYWRYSAAPPGRNYFLRVIVFDDGRRVTKKDGHYFAD